MRCLPLCRRTIQKRENKRARKSKRIVILEKEKIIRYAVDNKKNWKKKRKKSK